MEAVPETPTTFVLWSIAERGLQIAVSLGLGMAMARYLGPGDFGVLSSIWALAALCWPLAQIAYPLAVRDLVREPLAAGEILGTVGAINVAGAGVGLASYFVALFLLFDDPARPAIALGLIFAVTIAAQPLAVADLYFQANRQARLATVARSAGLLISGAGRLLFVLAGSTLTAIAATMAGDVLLPYILVVLALSRRRAMAPTRWSFSPARARVLASRAVPLLVASISVAIYMRIDQVMVATLSTSAQAGLYAAAVRISEGSYFVPLLVMKLMSPGLLRSRDDDDGRYREQTLAIFARLSVLATVVTATLLVGAPAIMGMFGSGFRGSADVLRIHAMSTIFVFWGVGQSVWTVTENQETAIMRRSLVGAALNVALNLILIPRLGAAGAAWATLVAYGLTTVAANALATQTREVFILQMRSLSPGVQRRVLGCDLSTLRRGQPPQ